MGELSVRIDADTAKAEHDINSFGRSLTGLVDNAGVAGAALQALAGRADETGDEMSSLSRRVEVASGSLIAMAGSAATARTALGGMQVLTVVSLIPALVTLSTTLAPIVAAFTVLTTGAFALAGAFGAVIGTGILAWGNKMSKQAQERIKQLREKQRLLKNEVEKQMSSVQAIRERISELRAEAKQLQLVKKSEEELSEAQAGRLKRITEHADALQAILDKRQKEAGLASKKLKQTKQEIKQTKEQTTIVGALGAQFSKLQEELVPVISSFGEAFIPLIKDGIGAIPELVKNTLDAMGGMQLFADALRDFGNAAFRIIPQVANFMMNLARQALPVLRDFLSWLRDNAADAFRGMLRSTKELAPEFKSFIDTVIGAMPELLEFGKNVVTVIVPALNDLINGFARLMSWVNNMKKENRELFITLTVLSPVILKAASVILKLGSALGVLLPSLNSVAYAAGVLVGVLEAIGLVVGGLVAAVVFFAAAWITNWKDIRGFTDTVVSTIVAMVQDIITVTKDALRLLGVLEQKSGKNQIEEFLKRSQDPGISTGTNMIVDPNQVAGGANGRAGDTSMGRVARAPEVEVTVVGDTDLVREVSAEVVEDKERRTNRNTGSF